MAHESNRSWMILPITSLVVIGGLVLIVSILTGGKGNQDSFSKTKEALSSILQEKQNEFTKAGLNIEEKINTASEAASLKDSEDDPFLGSESAEIIIVEFSDFECPFCRAAFPSIREFITKTDDRVRYIYRDFPVDALHPNARRAAEAAACAHNQNKFWQFHDKVFQNQSDLSRSALISYALQSGVSENEFIECLDSKQFAEEVEKDRSAGVDAGVRGTPTWFINGQKLEGVIPVSVWEQILVIIGK